MCKQKKIDGSGVCWEKKRYFYAVNNPKYYCLMTINLLPHFVCKRLKFQVTKTAEKYKYQYQRKTIPMK